MPDSVLLDPPPPVLADDGPGSRGGRSGYGGGDDHNDGHGDPVPLPIGNARLLVILALIASTMLFSGFIFSYVVQRGTQPPATTTGVPRLPSLWLNTTCVIASSVALLLAHIAQRRGRIIALRRWLFVTLAFAGAFLVVQVRLWRSLEAAGFVPSTSNYPGYFYLLTFAHFAHALVGVLLLLVATVRALAASATARLRTNLDVVAVFWHFVGLIWLTIWLVLTT